MNPVSTANRQPPTANRPPPTAVEQFGRPDAETRGYVAMMSAHNWATSAP